METISSLIDSIIHTLDSVSVTGHDNWDKLLGSIRALETIKQSLVPPEKEDENG